MHKKILPYRLKFYWAKSDQKQQNRLADSLKNNINEHFRDLPIVAVGAAPYVSMKCIKSTVDRIKRGVKNGKFDAKGYNIVRITYEDNKDNETQIYP